MPAKGGAPVKINGMINPSSKVFLFVHVICCVKGRESILTKPVRNVLFPRIRQVAADKLARIVAVNGVENHLHILLQLHPSFGLSQVVKTLKDESSLWLNLNKFLPQDFEWEEDYMAYSVSPSAIRQVTEYIDQQEVHHKTRTLDSELEAFDRLIPG